MRTFKIIQLATAQLTSRHARAYTPDANTKALWDFDESWVNVPPEDAHVDDNSGNENVLYPNSGVWSADGVFENAAKANAAGLFTCADNANLELGGTDCKWRSKIVALGGAKSPSLYTIYSGTTATCQIG